MREELVGTANVARFPTDGPPLILWHGLARRWQDYATLLPWLTPQWSVIALDHRGHGKSSRMPGSYLVPDYVADAVAVLEAIADRPALLYGHSLGALVAVGVAAARPDLVKGIVLEDPPSPEFLTNIGNTSYTITWQAMQRLAGCTDIAAAARDLSNIMLLTGQRLGDVRSAAALSFLASCLADLDPDTLTAPIAGTWLGDFDFYATAAQATCQTLLLAADPAAGGMLPADDAAALTLELPFGKRVDFPGRGHLLHGEHPAAVAAEVVPFLESLS